MLNFMAVSSNIRGRQASHLAALAAGMSTSKAAEVASAEATFPQKLSELTPLNYPAL